MAKLKSKLAIAALIFALSPIPTFASELVEYDARNLDEILDNNGIDYDKDAVAERKKEYIKNPNDNIAHDYEVVDVKEDDKLVVEADGSLDLVKEETLIVEDTSPAPIYSKTPVYERVVDISEHQNPDHIEYDKFAADIDGAILRTSITKADTLEIRKDYHIEKHYKELSKRGVPLGFYHYSRAINKAEAEKEAQYVTGIIRDKLVSLPVYIDIEDDKRQAKATKGQISEVAQAFVAAMNRNGYVAGIYSYPWFAKEYLTKDVRNNNEFWIADYESKGFTGYKQTDFDSWQFTHQARVKGHRFGVDMSVLYKDYPYIIRGKSHKPLDQLVTEIINGKWGVGADRVRRLEYAGYKYDIVQKAVNQRLRVARG